MKTEALQPFFSKALFYPAYSDKNSKYAFHSFISLCTICGYFGQKDGKWSADIVTPSRLPTG